MVLNVGTVKAVTSFFCGVGAQMCVSNVITATTPNNVRMGKKIVTALGGMCIAGIVAKKVADYAEETIDQIVDTVKSIQLVADNEPEEEEKEEETNETA